MKGAYILSKEPWDEVKEHTFCWTKPEIKSDVPWFTCDGYSWPSRKEQEPETKCNPIETQKCVLGEGHIFLNWNC